MSGVGINGLFGCCEYDDDGMSGLYGCADEIPFDGGNAPTCTSGEGLGDGDAETACTD